MCRIGISVRVRVRYMRNPSAWALPGGENLDPVCGKKKKKKKKKKSQSSKGLNPSNHVFYNAF